MESDRVDPYKYLVLLEDSIYKNPLALLTIKDRDTLALIREEYLPYSTGFEIECHYGPTYDVNNFKDIPYIMEVINGSGEQRYRIPAGIKGLICLYNISVQLKQNSELNPGSGIHYHIDMTECYHALNYEIFNTTYFDSVTDTGYSHFGDWILSELSKWGYTGHYNSRGISGWTGHTRNWLRFQEQFKTAEIRVGEMTFDYEELVSKIIWANRIVREIKNKLCGKEKVDKYLHSQIDYEPIDASLVLKFIKTHIGGKNARLLEQLKVKEAEVNAKLKALREANKPINTPTVDMKAIMLKRTKKLGT